MSITSDETSGATARPPRDTAKYFNDLAGVYDQFTKSMEAPDTWLNRWLNEHLGTGHRALDVGCGTGRYALKLADRYDHVVAFDAAPAMIEIAKRDRSRSNIYYQDRDVLSVTPERDGRFDLVIAIGCIVHVGPPELLLGHFRSLVAPGGTLLIMEPMWHPEWGSRDWQTDFAFRTARAAWDTTGDINDVTVALQVILNPIWLDMAKIDRPLPRDDFIREYSSALPGVIIEEGYGPLGINAFAVRWHAEEE